MKIKVITLLTNVFVLLFADNLFAQGSLVANGVYTNFYPGEIDVWNPGNQITGFTLTAVGKQPSTLTYSNIFQFDEPLTNGVRVFSVPYNAPITFATISSGNYTELQFGSAYTFGPYGTYYLGFYTGNNFAPPYPPQMPYVYNDPDFGWAEVRNVNGAVEVLASAVEYGGSGIYAGTTDIIEPAPEPASILLLAGGLAFLSACKRF